MASYVVDSSDLVAIAEAIRTRGNTTVLLSFPNDFIDAIGDIPYEFEPTDTIDITVNNVTVNVKNYASANVHVPVFVPTETITITENNVDVDVSNYAYASIRYPGYIPTDTILITQKGLQDVSRYAMANVQTPGIVPEGTETFTITQNGITSSNVYDKASVEIHTEVSIGEYSECSYSDVTTGDSSVLTVTNPFNVVPKLVTVEVYSGSPTGNHIRKGIFTPEFGVVYWGSIPTSYYAYSPVSTLGTTGMRFVMDSSTFSAKQYSGSIAWDTAVTYRVRFYK